MFNPVFLAPKIFSVWYTALSIRFYTIRFDRLMFVFKFSPGISPSVCICSASSSGFVVWVRIFRRVRKYHGPSVFRFLPAILRRPCHHRLLRCRFSLLPCFGRSSVSRLLCYGVSRPSVRTCRLSPVNKVFFRVYFIACIDRCLPSRSSFGLK